MLNSVDCWVTIIIPTFDRPDAVNLQIKRLLTFQGVSQIIVVDDHSQTPITFEDTKVTIVRNSKNIGEAESINLGVSLIKTRYFCILSDDDMQDFRWLEAMRIATIRSPGSAIYYPATAVIDNNSIIRVNPALKFRKMRLYGFLKPPAFAGCIFDLDMISHQLQKRFRPNSSVASDMFQWLELGIFASFQNVPNAEAKWYKNTNQQSEKLHDLNEIDTYIKLLAEWFKLNPDHLRFTTRGALILRYIQLCRNQHNFRRLSIFEIGRMVDHQNSKTSGPINILLSLVTASLGGIFLKFEVWVVNTFKTKSRLRSEPLSFN